MSELVGDCPRCGAELVTFDVLGSVSVGENYGWQTRREAFCVCRYCKRSTIFILLDREIGTREIVQKAGGLSSMKGSISNWVNISDYVSQKDEFGEEPPEHLPQDVHEAFVEGAKCHSVGCHNAAGTMFRLCVDLATRPLLPKAETSGLNARTRRDLGLRLQWLFDNGALPEALRDLSTCIREDGNDGAHAGTLSSDDAEDLLDFTIALLERMYTEPKQLELARARREERRAKPKT